jgi:hypothetical protein
MEIITLLSLLVGLGGLALGIINQMQIRQQTHRSLQVKIATGMDAVFYKVDAFGTPIPVMGIVYIIIVVNPGLVPVTIKGIGIQLPNEDIFKQPVLDRNLPLELSGGTEHRVNLPAYILLETLEKGGWGNIIRIKAIANTPLKPFQSRLFKIDIPTDLGAVN